MGLQIKPARNQGSKLGGNNTGGGGGDRKKNSHGIVSENVSKKVAFLICYIAFGTSALLSNWWQKYNTRHEEITWKDFAENYLARGRVAKVESLDGDWLRIHTAPGVSADGAKTFRLILDSLDAYKNAASVTNTLEIKVERQNEAPVMKKKKARK